MNLSNEDKTPENFCIEKIGIQEKAKRVIRKYAYPLLNHVKETFIEKKYNIKKRIGCDRVFLGQRGNDYEAHRERVNKHKPIGGSTIMIIGVGTGRDLESWLVYKPKKIIAVDYFSYQKAWSLRTEYFHKKYNTKIEFIQADILNLNMIEGESIDIVGSDAVFEHIIHFTEAMKELHRILRKGGVLYATYGPLWNSWGGDHISGRDHLKEGYNHITLSESEYGSYLDSFGEYNHSEHDGRTWIKNGLFSYLKPEEYIKQLGDAGFKKKYISVLLEERALKYESEYCKEFNELESRFGLDNILVTGMTIIYANSEA